MPPVAYLLAANLFLRFGFGSIFSSTNMVDGKLASGWSVWPGVVHLRGLRIVFQDHNLQWSLDVERARVSIRLRELLSRTFRATEVSGEGATFRMRHRVPPESKRDRSVQTLPPIPEFATPAVFEARVPEAPIPDDRYELWSVHLENVDVGLREFWVHFVRYQGKGRAQGAFRLRPARNLWVNSSSLRIEGGRVTLGDEVVMKTLSGTISCTVHPFDVRVPVGREVFRHISSRLELHAQGLTPDPVLRLFAADAAFSLDTTPGELDLVAKIAHGKFSEDSWLRVKSPRVGAVAPAGRFEAKEVTASLSAQAGERAEARLEVQRAELTPTQLDVKPGVLRGVVASSLSVGLDTAGSMSSLERRLDVERIEVSDARLLNAFGQDLGFTSGDLAFGLRAREEAGTLAATVEGQVRRVRFERGALELEVNGKLLASLLGARPDQGSGKLSVGADLTGSRLSQREAQGGALVLTETEHLRFDAEVARDARGGTRATFKLASARPVLSLVNGKERRRMASAEALRAEGQLAQSAGGILQAKLSASSRRARALLGQTWLRARPSLELELTDFDPSRESGKLSSELTLRDGLASGTNEEDEDCPWATLASAQLRFALALGSADARGSLQATLRQARVAWGDFQVRGALELSTRFNSRAWRDRIGELDFTARARSVTLISGKGERSGWEAQVPELTWRGQLQANDGLAGAFELLAPNSKARIGRTRMQTDFSALTRLSSVDIARREARFSGKFSLNDTRLSVGKEAITGWWANIEADSGLLIARDNVDLSVPFRADLRDALPGMTILAAEGSVPSLITDALPLRRLSVVGMVARRCRLTNVQLTQASGGPLLARGLLQSTTDAVRGAFLIRLSDWEAISAGVGFNPNGTDVALLAGDDWLKQHTRAIDRISERTLAKPCVSPPPECGTESDDP